MLDSVELRNFKSFRHQRIALERLTVFVGANASGKTSVLEAIGLVDQAARSGGDQAFFTKMFSAEQHCDWLYTRGSKDDFSISCSTNGGTFAVSAKSVSGFPPPRVELFGTSPWRFKVMIDKGALEAAGSVTQYAKFNSSRMTEATYSTRVPPQIGPDGGELASVLAYMALNDPDGFDKLIEEMRKFLPNLRRIRFTKATVVRTIKEEVRIGKDTLERNLDQEYQGDKLLFDFANANNISAHTVSEGTMMLLGILTVLLGPSRPDILLLDDLEHGLHPLAQKSLLEILGKIMERFPNLQVIATAHSPYLLDCLKPEQVRMLTIGPDGYSVCGKLTDHPQFEKWKVEMAPGELWSLFGEKWVAEGQAK